jgi:acetylornithine deacetylase/succinyl-diaminopimelate desuccinylase-like protein
MCGFDPEVMISATVPKTATAAIPRRPGARVDVSLTEREIRAIIRATTLVADVLRPELIRQTGSAPESPLVTAYQTLTAACERHGIDLGIARSSSHESA